jgi:hypothetical protein
MIDGCSSKSSSPLIMISFYFRKLMLMLFSDFTCGEKSGKNVKVPRRRSTYMDFVENYVTTDHQIRSLPSRQQ